MKVKQQNDQEYLSDVMAAMEQKYNEEDGDARAEFQSRKDEIRNKNLEEKQALRVLLESNIEELWQHFQDTLRQYQEGTEDRRKAYNELKAKDERSSREIATQMKRLQKITDTNAQLRGRLAELSSGQDGHTQEMRDERDRLSACYQQLRLSMNQQRDQEQAKLIHLTNISNNAIEVLQKHAQQGEKILRIGEMCHRLETEEEQVLPFYQHFLTDDQMLNTKLETEEVLSETVTEVSKEFCNLDNFWRRYNKVMLDKLTLTKEKCDLTEENQHLRSMLKQYLDGITVNSETLTANNPLFVVNHKSNVPLSVKVSDPRVKRPSHTVIEAAHVAKNFV